MGRSSGCQLDQGCLGLFQIVPGLLHGCSQCLRRFQDRSRGIQRVPGTFQRRPESFRNSQGDFR